MPHRPLFVSQCHHFSPVIYFIAISVSLPPPLVSSSLFLHLRSSRSLSFSLSLSHPLTRPHRVHEHLLARNSPPNHTTQFRSPHPLLEALLYASISVSFSLFLFLSRELELSFRLFRSRCLVPAAFERLCRMREREKEGTRDRTRSKERQRKNKREKEERERRAR